MTRAEEIASADAEIVAAGLEYHRADAGSDKCRCAYLRLSAALKARAALDEPVKPRLRTPDQLWEWWKGHPHNFSVVVNEMRREIAELVRAGCGVFG